MPTNRLAALSCLAVICGLLFAAGPESPPDNAAEATREIEPTMEERILAALKQPTKLDGQAVTLQDALSFLSDFHQIPIHMDLRAMADAGIDLESPMNVRLEGLPLRSLLNVLMSELDLAWLVENEVLLITTRDVADTRLVTTVYAVADLLAVRDQFGQVDELFADELDNTELIDAIQFSVQVDTWEANGGAGNISTLKGALVVSNTAQIHEQVVSLLDALRKARTQQFAGDAAARYLPIPVDEGDASPAQRKIRAALAAKIKWNFVETPLSEFAGSLAATHDMAVLLDHKALADAGVDLESPLEMRVEGITLESALKLILREIDGAFYVADDALHITTRDVEDTRTVARLYPVRDLVVDLETGENDFESLLEIIQNNVWPDSWEANGGAGVFEPFDGSLCLIVNNTQEVHAEVQKLLTGLRNIPSYKEPPMTAAGADERGGRILLRAYFLYDTRGHGLFSPIFPGKATPEEMKALMDSNRTLSHVPAESMREIVEAVKEAVGPEAWKQEGVVIKALPDRIVVNHSCRIHRIVQEAVRDLGYTPVAAPRKGSDVIPFVVSPIPVVGDASALLTPRQ